MLLRVRWTWTDAPLKYKGVSQNSTTGRHTVVKKLEAVQNLQDEPGSKTRSRTDEVEEYNCMPYMQLRLLKLFKPTYDSQEQDSRQGDPKSSRREGGQRTGGPKNPASQEPSVRV